MGTAGSTGPRSGWLKTHPHPQWSPVHTFLLMNHYIFMLLSKTIKMNVASFWALKNSYEIPRFQHIQPLQGLKFAGRVPNRFQSNQQVVVDFRCRYGGFGHWYRMHLWRWHLGFRSFNPQDVSFHVSCLQCGCGCTTQVLKHGKLKGEGKGVTQQKRRGSKDDCTSNLVASRV